jgi:hypothetical protein
MKTEIIRLNLVSPLYYVRETGADPFVPSEEGGEYLFCFELEPSLVLEFEPDPAAFPGSLVFGGKAVHPAGAADCTQGEKLTLPAGNYLFFQARDILGKEEIAEMAVEIQQEGLWQRLKPGTRVYLRRLFEDRRGVTQLFRPYREEEVV